MEELSFKRNFASKLATIDADAKARYSVLKNELMSYTEVKNRYSNYGESFKLARLHLARFSLVGKTLRLHLALDPKAAEYNLGTYPHDDLSDKKQYVETPFTVKLKSDLSVKRAVALIADVMLAKGIARDPNYSTVDYTELFPHVEGFDLDRRGVRYQMAALPVEEKEGYVDPYLAKLAAAAAEKEEVFAEDASEDYAPEIAPSTPKTPEFVADKTTLEEAKAEPKTSEIAPKTSEIEPKASEIAPKTPEIEPKASKPEPHKPITTESVGVPVRAVLTTISYRYVEEYTLQGEPYNEPETARKPKWVAAERSTYEEELLPQGEPYNDGDVLPLPRRVQKVAPLPKTFVLEQPLEADGQPVIPPEFPIELMPSVPIEAIEPALTPIIEETSQIAEETTQIAEEATQIEEDYSQEEEYYEEVEPDLSGYTEEEISMEIELRLKRNFVAKLAQADDSIKEKYSVVKNELMSYAELKNRFSNYGESFKKARAHIARISLVGKTLRLHLALNPNAAEYNQGTFPHDDLSDKKQYEETPFTVKLKSELSLRRAKALIADAMEEAYMDKKEVFKPTDYLLLFPRIEGLMLARKGIRYNPRPMELVSDEEE